MMKEIALVFVFFLFFRISLFSQNVAINTAGTAANANAILDVSSTAQGILIPRMTTAQRQALKDPATGLMIYNTSTNELNFYNGSGWYRVPGNFISATSGGGAGPGGGIAVNTSGNSADNSAILDVSATDKGLLIPKTTQGSVTAVTAMMIYNTATNRVNYYNGTSWQVPCAELIDNTKGSGATGQGVSINTSANAPDNSAILDISSTTKGLIIPSMTSGQRDALKTPATGLIVYNNSQNRVENWIGTAWHEWVSYIPATPGAITGVTTVASGTTGITYSISAVTGATSYAWTVPSGATITSGQGTTGITVTFGSSSGNVSVTASNGCGTSAARTLAVAVTSPSSDFDPGSCTMFAAWCPSSFDCCDWTNNTSYNITFTMPVDHGVGWSPGNTFTINAGQTVSVCAFQAGGFCGGLTCCFTVSWTATDGGSGGFDISF